MEYLKLIELTGGLVLAAKLPWTQQGSEARSSGYLAAIADTMSQFPSQVRARAPYEELAGLSKQAEDYAVSFRRATSDVLAESETESFANLLAPAHNAKEAVRINPPTERDERLRLISEIAGSFRVAATTLRGSASQLKN